MRQDLAGRLAEAARDPMGLPAAAPPPSPRPPRPPRRLPLAADAIAGSPGPAWRAWNAPARLGELASLLAPPLPEAALPPDFDRRLLPLLAAWCLLLRRLSAEATFGLRWQPPASASRAAAPAAPAARWLHVALDDAAPFGALVMQLRDLLAGPLAPEAAGDEAAAGLGVEAAFVVAPQERSDLPWQSPTLALQAEAVGGELHCRLCASHLAISDARAGHILAQLVTVLEQALAATLAPLAPTAPLAPITPTAPISELSLVTPEALTVLPAPAAPLDRPELPAVPVLFAEWAAGAPASPALALPGAAHGAGERLVTYGELCAAAAAVARGLRAADLRRGGVVAIHGRRSAGLVAAMLGVMAAGGALLILDPGLPAERKARLVRIAAAAHLLDLEAETPSPWAAGLVTIRLDPATGHPAPASPHTNVEPAAAAAAAAAELAAAGADLPGDAPAYVFFTSGTTGVPKGVVGCHRGLAHFLRWQRDTFGAGPGDRCAQLTHPAFDVMLRDVFLPLASGGCLCLPGEADERPDRVLAWLERSEVSLLHAVPSLARRWLDSAPPGLSLARLRHVFFAGEPLPAALVADWRQAFPRTGAQVNLYGPTETTLAKCAHRLGAELTAGIQPIGMPLPQTQLLVLGAAGRLCGIGEPGELVIRTPFRSLGYLEEAAGPGRLPAGAAATRPVPARGFAPNPFSAAPDDLVYATGDRGRYRPDGSLDILGRLDGQIKVRGVRLDPAEIETSLCSLEGVRQAVVGARELVPGDPQLVAWVVAADPPPAAADLRRGLAAQLPGYLVPAWYVLMPFLPLNANGKLDRAALPDPRSISRASGAAAGSSAAPAGAIGAIGAIGDMETRVAGWWRAVLDGVEAHRDEDFFTVGGDSVRALRLAVLAERELGIEMTVAIIVARPTIAAQASWLGERTGRPAAGAAEGAADGSGHLVLGAGRPRRLFAFPPLLGYGLAYHRIAGFTLEHAVHAFDFLEVADPIGAYSAALRREQPEGPYTLLGYSAGGNLAFEVAAVLEAGGAAVDAVIMLDAKRFVVPELLSDAEIEELVRANLDHLGGLLLADEHFHELVRDEPARRRMAARMRAFLRFERGRTNDGPIAADIHFLHSTNRPVCTSWAQVTRGAFQVYPGSGDHLAMTQPPHAAVNGALIAAILQRTKETDLARHRP